MEQKLEKLVTVYLPNGEVSKFCTVKDYEDTIFCSEVFINKDSVYLLDINGVIGNSFSATKIQYTIKTFRND